MVLLLGHSLPTPSQVSMQGGRLADMQRSIVVLDHGGPPLLGVLSQGTPKPGDAGANLSAHKGIPGLPGTPYAVGPGDDQGMYLYVPLLAHYLGLADPRAALRDLYIALAALGALVYPLLAYEIFASLLAAVLAPAALWYILRTAVPLVDVYWAPALVLLLAVPLLLALRHRSTAGRLVGIGAVCVLASLCDSIRSYTGTGLFLAAVIAALCWLKGWRPRLAALGIAFLAMLSVYPFALDGVRAYRDHEIAASLTSSGSATHPLWHQIYLGLSYIQPNRFGIEYSDTDGLATALLYDPNVQDQSPAYEQDVEHAFASVVAHDPGYVLADYAEKTVVVVGSAVHEFWLPIVIYIVALLYWKEQRRETALPLLLLPVLFVTSLPPVLTVPLDEYQLPWLAMTGLAAFLAIGRPLAFAEQRSSAILRRHYPAAGRWLQPSSGLQGAGRTSVPVVPVAAAALVLAAAAVVLGHDATIWRARFAYASEATLPELSGQVPTAAPVASWDFGHKGPGWATYAGTRLRKSAHGVAVRTSGGTYAYQLSSPSILLPPGRYVVVARGTVQSGGLSIGALDLRHDDWLGGATGNFWYGQAQGGSYVMAVPVANPARAWVKVVLANWHPGGGTSTWDIESVAVVPAS